MCVLFSLFSFLLHSSAASAAHGGDDDDDDGEEVEEVELFIDTFKISFFAFRIIR